MVITFEKTARGRGRARGGAKSKVSKTGPSSHGSHGSVMSVQSLQDHSQAMVSFHDSIPASAKLPCTSQSETVWVNNKGQVKDNRVVLGDRVLIRQQPVSPPPVPQILVLSDQMLSEFQSPDRYIVCTVMSGYTLKDYANDIRDSALDLNYPYIIIYLGTMQLGIFKSAATAKDLKELIVAISNFSPKSMIVVSGLVPRPLDYPRSAAVSQKMSKLYQNTVQELRDSHGKNCSFVSVFAEFLDDAGNIKNQPESFKDGLYLTMGGIRVLRAAWLRFLGYFPKKAK